MAALGLLLAERCESQPRIFPGEAELRNPTLLGADENASMPFAQVVLCTIDVGQAATSLGQAGTSLRDAILGCELPAGKDGTASANCAVGVGNFIYFVAQTISYLGAAASDCASSVNLQAYCTADIANLVLSLDSIMLCSASASQTCKNATQDIGPVRRLSPLLSMAAVPTALVKYDKVSVKGELHSSVRDVFEQIHTAIRNRRNRQEAIANCVFNAGEAAMYLVRAGLALHSAIIDCDPVTLHHASSASQRLCSVDVNGLIGSFSFAAQAIAYSVSQCPVQPNANALCAGDINGIIGGVAGLAASGSSLPLTCGRWRKKFGEFSRLPGRSLVRRLAEQMSVMV